eukprot:GILK01007665.1.p1 GENE.GILK01007665.1~~GILK01007665.1.p1  ORF type:complete len:298 (+),score=31.86 GILK01007665.1:3-896(+)
MSRVIGGSQHRASSVFCLYVLCLCHRSTMADKRVSIYPNRADADGKVIILPSTFAELLTVASSKLKIQATRAFSSTGAEIDSLEVIRDNDSLYFSQGDPFFKSKKAQEGTRKYKVCILGSGAVGKSCVTLRFTRNTFVDDYDATIEDLHSKLTEVDEKLVSLDILDTAGQDDYVALLPQWLRNQDGYIFVYSMTERSTFFHLRFLYDHLMQTTNFESRPPLIVIANKLDLQAERTVSEEEGRALAQEFLNAVYIETSARTGFNITEAFSQLVREIRKSKEPKTTRSKPFLNHFCSVL